MSKATVRRLYRRVGFEGTEQLRDHVCALRDTGVPLVGFRRRPQDFDRLVDALAIGDECG